MNDFKKGDSVCFVGEGDDLFEILSISGWSASVKNIRCGSIENKSILQARHPLKICSECNGTGSVPLSDT